MKAVTKKAAIILLAMSLLMMTGCGGSDEKVISGDVTAADNGGTQAQADDETQTENKETGANVAAQKGYVFVFNDTTIEIDADMAPVLANLGEPASYYEAESCAFEGLDKIYTYDDFEIETYPQGEKDYISIILFKTDAITTPEGIYVGSTQEELEEAYGSDYVEEKGMRVYKKDGMKLCFIVTNGDVTSIQYVSTVLEEN